jgi:hypothetical protein
MHAAAAANSVAAAAAEPQVSQGPGSRPAKASEQDPALHQPTLGVASTTNALAPSAMPDASLSATLSPGSANDSHSLVGSAGCLRGHVTLDLVFDNGAGRAFGLSRFILSALVSDKYKLDACAFTFSNYCSKILVYSSILLE